VRKIDMDDTRAIEALLDSSGKGAEEPLIDEDGNTIDTAYVTGRIKEIGEKITQVSRVFDVGPPASGSVKVARNFAYLIGFDSNL
jgi:hypothetical protein